MNAQVKYDGEVIGNVVTNHGMTVWEALELIGIDIKEMDGEDPVWDVALFELEYT